MDTDRLQYEKADRTVPGIGIAPQAYSSEATAPVTAHDGLSARLSQVIERLGLAVNSSGNTRARVFGAFPVPGKKEANAVSSGQGSSMEKLNGQLDIATTMLGMLEENLVVLAQL